MKARDGETNGKKCGVYMRDGYILSHSSFILASCWNKKVICCPFMLAASGYAWEGEGESDVETDR